MNHKVKILLHLMIGELNWWEYKEKHNDLSEAKKIVQKILKPGQVPGGTPDENIGKHGWSQLSQQTKRPFICRPCV